MTGKNYVKIKTEFVIKGQRQHGGGSIKITFIYIALIKEHPVDQSA